MNDSSISNMTDCAHAYLTNGQLEEAKSLYIQLCRLDGDNEEHWLTLAALYGESGKIDDAIECVNKAIELDNSYVEAYLTKAHLLQQAGNCEEAFECALTAVKHDDTYDEAIVFLTGLAGQMKRFDEAERWAKRIVDLKPTSIDAMLNLGNAQHELTKYQESESTYKKILVLSPTNQSARLGLARSLHAQGHYSETIELLEPILASETKNCYAEDLFAACLISLGRLDEAFEILVNLIKSHPDYVVSYIHIAGILETRGDYIQAIRYLSDAIDNANEPLEVLNEQARICHEYGMPKQAIENCTKALVIDPDNETAHFFLALALADTTRYEEALNELEIILDITPDNAKALNAKASILERLGHDDEAHQIVTSLMKQNAIPDGIANVFARLCHKYDECDQALEMIDNTLKIPDLDKGIECSLLFTLGLLHDRLHNYKSAFDAAKRANELKPYIYDHSKYTDYINQLISPELTALANQARKINTSHRVRPVFIVGMPRSGTSLVEQIITSHPLVIAGGERHEIASLVSKLPLMEDIGGTYPECLSRLTPEIINQILTGYDEFTNTLPSEVSVMTDKMPENFSHIIFIKMLFPDAKIIHCVRNPIDTCLSIYFRQFAGYRDYAYDLEDLGKHYNEYKRLMNYYRDETDISFFEVQYENLINYTEEVSRKIIDYCGLEWNEQCLRYYESNQIVRTASYEQAKQPIYTSSIEKWRHYESQLQPLLKVLHSLE